MDFLSDLAASQGVLVEGSIYDRLKRLAGDDFDPQLAHLGLIYSESGRRALNDVYGSYVTAAARTNKPILLFTPSWRANQERISRSNYHGREVNQDSVRFLDNFRKNRKDTPIFIGGLIGCKNDCYDPKQGLSVDDAASFHEPQISALAQTEVDLLFASTLPAIPEAIGIAKAMANTTKPYILSFVSGADGVTLDGVSFAQAFEMIDSSVSRKPLGYFVNCTHPQLFLAGIDLPKHRETLSSGRLIGFQGNTSRRDPREFDNLTELESESADDFARASINLKYRFKMKFLGGCCGTGPEHIEAIGKMMEE